MASLQSQLTSTYEAEDKDVSKDSDLAHTAEEWEGVRETIALLYGIEDKPLREVQLIMQTIYGFRGTERQYKRRIAQWNLDKYVKDSDMKIILRKQLKRKFDEDKESLFKVNGRPVDPKKMERFVRRKGITEDDLPQTDVATPTYITCLTPSDDGHDRNRQHGEKPASDSVLISVDRETTIPSTLAGLAVSRNSITDLDAHQPTISQGSSGPNIGKYQINLLANSPFERCSPRYHLSSSPSWYRAAITPSNPLSLLSPIDGSTAITQSRNRRLESRPNIGDEDTIRHVGGNFPSGQKLKVVTAGFQQFVAYWMSDGFYSRVNHTCTICKGATSIIFRASSSRERWLGRYKCKCGIVHLTYLEALSHFLMLEGLDDDLYYERFLQRLLQQSVAVRQSPVEPFGDDALLQYQEWHCMSVKPKVVLIGEQVAFSSQDFGS